MNSLKKKCQVVMLPTQKASSLYLLNNELKLGLNEKGNSAWKNQHLYIISDDGINEGDWFIHKTDADCSIHRCIERPVKYNVISDNNINYFLGFCKKIIATTDTSLKINKKVTNPAIQEYIQQGTVCSFYESILPQPSPQFIQKFIESYDKGNIIVDVMVEYEIIKIKAGQYAFVETEQLKVDSNNYITITKVKDNWNSLEIAGLIRTFENNYFSNFKLKLDHSDRVEFVGKFIEDNLK